MKASDVRSLVRDDVLKHFLKVQAIPELAIDATVAAIDIGYGVTKFVQGKTETGDIQCASFPSITPLAPQESMGGDFFMSRNTKRISHGGTEWEVGPDVFEIATANDVRALHENFTSTETWRVLFYGALAYMEIDEIDYLVLGLPVSQMSKAREVEAIAKGTHTVCDKTVTVRNVLVIPQPLGALYSYAVRSDEFERFSRTNTLVVDPGYMTFDFLVTKGFSVNPNRTGARAGGMSHVLNMIAGSLSKALGDEFTDINSIDAALMSKPEAGKPRTLWVYGKEVDMTDHIKDTRTVIDASLNVMLSKIGDNKDLSQIILAGGPSQIFEKSIRRQMPHHDVKVLPDGVYSNVIGFQLWGMMVAFGQLLKNKAA